MTFETLITTDRDVVFAPAGQNDQVDETGLWKIDMLKVDRELTRSLLGVSFGNSIETFMLGLEIMQFDIWPQTKNYVSYRPKTKTIISVAQINL